MNKYTLNRSYGPWSAGTEVEIVTAEDGYEKVVGVTPINPGIHGVDTVFDVPIEYLTQRRIRTEEIAVPTREQKRVGIPRKYQAGNTGQQTS